MKADHTTFESSPVGWWTCFGGSPAGESCLPSESSRAEWKEMAKRSDSFTRAL